MDRKLLIADIPAQIRGRAIPVTESALCEMWECKDENGVPLVESITAAAYKYIAPREFETRHGKGAGSSFYDAESGLYYRALDLVLRALRSWHAASLCGKVSATYYRAALLLDKSVFMALYNDWLLAAYPMVGLHGSKKKGKILSDKARRRVVSSATSRAWKTLTRTPMRLLPLTTRMVRPYMYVSDKPWQEVEKEGLLLVWSNTEDGVTDEDYKAAVADYEATKKRDMAEGACPPFDYTRLISTESSGSRLVADPVSALVNAGCLHRMIIAACGSSTDDVIVTIKEGELYVEKA